MANGNDSNESSSIVAIVAIVLLIGVAVLFFMYGLPILREMMNDQQQPDTINIEIPSPMPPSPQN